MKHLNSGQKSNKSCTLPSGWGGGKVTIPSWLNRTRVLHLKFGTVHYLDLELGISKFKCRLAIYLMCQVPPGANSCVSVSHLLLIITRTPAAAMAPSLRAVRFQPASARGCCAVYCRCWSHHRGASPQSCPLWNPLLDLRTWLLAPSMAPILLPI